MQCQQGSPGTLWRPWRWKTGPAGTAAASTVCSKQGRVQVSNRGGSQVKREVATSKASAAQQQHAQQARANPPGKARFLSQRSSQQGRPAAQPSAHLKAKPPHQTAHKPTAGPPTLTVPFTGRQSDCAKAPVLLVPVPSGQLCTARKGGKRVENQCTKECSIDLMFSPHCPGLLDYPAIRCSRDKAGTKQGSNVNTHSCSTPGRWVNHRCQQRCPVGTAGKKLSRMCCDMSQGCR